MDPNVIYGGAPAPAGCPQCGRRRTWRRGRRDARRRRRRLGGVRLQPGLHVHAHVHGCSLGGVRLQPEWDDMWLQPGWHVVAAWVAWGCSLGGMGLQAASPTVLGRHEQRVVQIDVAMAQATRVHPRTRAADGEGHVQHARRGAPGWGRGWGSGRGWGWGWSRGWGWSWGEG